MTSEPGRSAARGKGGLTGQAQRQGAQAIDMWGPGWRHASEPISSDLDRWIRDGRLGSGAQRG
jgi:hypothetical protein